MTAAATKTKKKKAQTLSLGQFVSSSSNQTYQTPKGLTAEDLLNLPTGPRQRTAEELAGTRLGGGFRSYGDRNNESSNSRWGSGRGSGGGDEEGRRSSREPLGPSRADEIDDWGAMKKSTVGGGFDRRERGGGGVSVRVRIRGPMIPIAGRVIRRIDRPRGGSLGGLRRRGGWDLSREPRFSGGSGSAFDSLRERRVANDSSDSDTWGKKREESSVGGGGGGGRPRLNLQPRKLPVGEVENVKPAKGSNPFGEARPREEVLKEKGEDWKEIDEKLEAMKMKELGSGDRFKRGGGKPRSVEDLSEKSWRKNQAVDADVAPPSGENNENGGHTEESEPKPEEDAQK
ncbi:putative plant specific eukaryotic initiation factor 4B [Helianthus annuus]|nr:putative plant specific eukaryotic initiation factor 4B [Helianthus annuus]